MQHCSTKSNIFRKNLIYGKWWLWIFSAAMVISLVGCSVNNGSQEPSTYSLESTDIAQNDSVETESSNSETNNDSANSEEMLSSNDQSYTGPKFEVYYESDWKQGDINPKIVDLYAEIDKASDTWRDQVKIVLTHLSAKYSDYSEVTLNVFNSESVLSANQTNYTYLVASYNLSSGIVTWYPDGGGINAEKVDEEWRP